MSEPVIMKKPNCSEWYIQEYRGRQGNGNGGRTKSFWMGPRCWKGSEKPCPHETDDHPFCAVRGCIPEEVEA